DLVIQRVKRSGDGDPRQARALAATAAGATGDVVHLLNVLAFAHHAVTHARGFAGAEVVPARHQRELVKLARVPDARPLAVGHVQLDFVLHVEAEARRADVGARAARQALL